VAQFRSSSTTTGIFAKVEFVRPDGTPRKAVAFVDLGTPQLVLEQTLGKELGIENAKQAVLHIGELEIDVPASEIQTDTGLGMTGPKGKRSLKVEAVKHLPRPKHYAPASASKVCPFIVLPQSGMSDVRK